MKKYVFPKAINFRFYIRTPGKKRKSFKIQKYFDRGLKVETLKDPVIDAVNTQFSQGKISIPEAKKELEIYIDRLYSKAGVSITIPISNNENLEHFERFWVDEYSHREIVDPNSSRGLFLRAINSLGPVSLLVGSSSEIQARLDQNFEPNLHGRMVGCIKTLLKYVGRMDVRLRKKRQPRQLPPHLTETELSVLLKKIESQPFRLFVQMAFYSGCRKGELLALNNFSLKSDGSLYIASQIKNGVETEPKSGSVGSAFLFKKGREIFPEWLKIKNQLTPTEIAHAADVLKQYCKAAFPEDPSKWIRFHDLRHSYAIHLLGMGASLTDVAQSLRNDIRVCQKFYAGFIMTQTRMLGLRKLEES